MLYVVSSFIHNVAGRSPLSLVVVCEAAQIQGKVITYTLCE